MTPQQIHAELSEMERALLVRALDQWSPRHPLAVLRAAQWICDTQDPETLADLIGDVPVTLASIARMRNWLAAFSDALRRRQPQ